MAEHRAKKEVVYLEKRQNMRSKRSSDRFPTPNLLLFTTHRVIWMPVTARIVDMRFKLHLSLLGR